MSELYADEYNSLGPAGSGRLMSGGVRRATGAVLFLALIGGVGLWAYRLGTRDAAEVPVIKAMEGPARVAPADPGGLRAAHQGLEVNAVLASRPAPAADDATLSPAPSALAEEDAPQGELVLAPMTLAEEDGAGGDLRMPLPDDGPAVAMADAGSGAVSGAAPDAAVEASLAASVAIVAAAQEAVAPVAAEPAAAVPAEAVAAEDAGARPMRRPAGLVRASAPAPAPAAKAASAAAKPAATPASPPASREVASVASGSRLVQLGAFDSEGIARQAWNILAKRHADLLGSKSLYVERTTANARVFYRLRVAGFQTADQTRQMCEALRARGVDCIPVTLQ